MAIIYVAVEVRNQKLGHLTKIALFGQYHRKDLSRARFAFAKEIEVTCIGDNSAIIM